MNNKNKSIWIDVLCIYLLADALIYLTGTFFQRVLLVYNSAFKEYFVTTYGNDSYRLGLVFMFIWIFLNLFQIGGSILSAQRKEAGRKILVVTSFFAVAFSLIQIILRYLLGNFYTKYSIAMSLPYSYGIALSSMIIIIYVFTRPVVKKEFE